MHQNSSSSPMTSSSRRVMAIAAWSKVILATGLVLLAITSVTEGGCSRFGHSCFGAHGKRSGDDLEHPNLSDPLATVLLPPDNGRFSNYVMRPRPISPYLRNWILGVRSDGENSSEQSKDLLQSTGGGGEERRK